MENKNNRIRVTPNVKIIEELSIESSTPKIAKEAVNKSENFTEESIANRTLSKSLITAITETITSRYSLEERQIAMINDCLQIPNSIEEAIESESSQKWIFAMEDEMNSLIQNETWELFDADKVTKKPLKTKWIYKYDENGNIKSTKLALSSKDVHKKKELIFLKHLLPLHVTTLWVH